MEKPCSAAESLSDCEMQRRAGGVDPDNYGCYDDDVKVHGGSSTSRRKAYWCGGAVGALVVGYLVFFHALGPSGRELKRAEKRKPHPPKDVHHVVPPAHSKHAARALRQSRSNAGTAFAKPATRK